MSRAATMRQALAALLLLTLAWLALPLAAQERITAYDSELVVNADGSLDVTEHISVRAEGQDIRSGIVRDFPTRYRDRLGNRVLVGLEVLEVLRDGQPEAWFTEKRSNGVRINTGGDEFLPVPADYTYTLRYRTTRQLGFFEDFDELYYNAIGDGWSLPIERGSVAVRLPQPVPEQELRVEAYTGAQGEQGQDYDARPVSPGNARWLLTRALEPGEGLTIVLGFPKGLVAEPTATQRFAWLLRDNRGVLVGLAGLVLLLLFCVRRWRRLGRDPEPGVVIVRYEPPAGQTPGGLRYLRRMGYDTRCFSADLLALAVAGHLRIRRDKGLLKDSWELERIDGATAPPLHEQASLMQQLFPGDARTLELKNTNATTVSAAQAKHMQGLAKRFSPALFVRNPGSIVIAAVLTAVTAAMAFMISGGAGVPFLFAITGVMVLVTVVFAVLIKAPTAEGRKLLDEIEGLRRYLGVAERDELKALPGPGAAPLLDAARYEALLPYAVALEVEDAWTGKFTAAAGAAAVAAASAGLAWYHGAGIGDMAGFTKAVGSGLSSQISSSSSVPGSSSGGGGGGSSGGGGGGGGGGGR